MTKVDIEFLATSHVVVPWTEEPGRLQSMGSLGVTFHFHALEKEMATHSSVLA